MRYTREEIKIPFAERHIIIETEEERVAFNEMIDFVVNELITTDGKYVAQEHRAWNMAHDIKHGV